MDRLDLESLNDVRKRLKKQTALFYNVSNLDEKKLSIETLLKEAMQRIVEYWGCPEHIAVSITYDSIVLKSDHFKETQWLISSKKAVHSQAVLQIKIFYPSEEVFSSSDMFSDDEQNLIESITTHLATKIENISAREDVKEQQDLLDRAYKLARIGTWQYDMINDRLTWSSVTKEVHGMDENYEPDVESTIQLFKEGYHRKAFELVAYNAIEHHIPFDVELKIISGKGDERWIRATGEPEFKDGVCTRFYGISQNVTDRRQAQEDLVLNEQRFKALVQDGSDMLAIMDEEIHFNYVSPTVERVLGWQPDYLVGKNALEFVHPEDKEKVVAQLTVLEPKESVELKPYRFKNSAGKWRWIETIITNLSDDPAIEGYAANSRDVTDKKNHQQQIIDSLKEKETLLAEIHHRVKNNLAVITGLLQLHISEEENQESLDRLYDSVSRIYTIGNIHEQLYQSNSFSKLKFNDNIRMLTSNIMDTFKSDKLIDIQFNDESLYLNINKALPCSLIVNEVITNILKHAFKGIEKGSISINLFKGENDIVKLIVEDNGVGLPDDFSVEGNSSLGLTLIDVLSRQLKAEYQYESSGEGTRFMLEFDAN